MIINKEQTELELVLKKIYKQLTKIETNDNLKYSTTLIISGLNVEVTITIDKDKWLHLHYNIEGTMDIDCGSNSEAYEYKDWINKIKEVFKKEHKDYINNIKHYKKLKNYKGSKFVLCTKLYDDAPEGAKRVIEIDNYAYIR